MSNRVGGYHVVAPSITVCQSGIVTCRQSCWRMLYSSLGRPCKSARPNLEVQRPQLKLLKHHEISAIHVYSVISCSSPLGKVCNIVGQRTPTIQSFDKSCNNYQSWVARGKDLTVLL